MYNKKDKKIVLEKLKHGLPVKQIYPLLHDSTYPEMLKYIEDLVAQSKITQEEIYENRRKHDKLKKEKKQASKMSVADFREKVASGNLTLEDVELFNRMILENKSMVTTSNVKIGILGFIKVGRFGQARRFFEKCLQRVGRNSPRGQEIFLLDKPLKELELQRRIKLSNKGIDLSKD